MNIAVAIIFAVIAYIGSVVLALIIGAGLAYAKFKGIDFDDIDDIEYIDETEAYDDELWKYDGGEEDEKDDAESEAEE